MHAALAEDWILVPSTYTRQSLTPALGHPMVLTSATTCTHAHISTRTDANTHIIEKTQSPVKLICLLEKLSSVHIK